MASAGAGKSKNLPTCSPFSANRPIREPYQGFHERCLIDFESDQMMVCGSGTELSPNLGDGLMDQAAAVWDCEAAGLTATSIPSVNLTP